MRLHVLGIPVDAVKSEADLERILAEFLASNRAHLVVTPNAEMAVAAGRDETFRSVLNRADLAVPDSMGLTLATQWLTGRRPKRVPGVELLEVLLRVAERSGARIFFFGGKDHVASDAAKKLVANFPTLNVVGTESGFRFWGWRVRAHEIVKRIARARPDVLIVALGHGRQEKWLAHHLWELPSVRVAMGVGGSLDYLAGRVRRAPQGFRTFGMEWFWRLIVQPWRLPRILTATVTFTWIAFWAKFRPRQSATW